MRNIFILLLLVGTASALLNPNTDINWDKSVDHNITLGTGHYTSMSMGNYINTDFGLENNSTTGKIQINLASDKGLRFSSGELRAYVGDGIDLSAAGIEADPTDFIGTAYGLYEGSNDARVNLTSNGGLEFGAVNATLGSLGVNLDGTSLLLGAGGLKANETRVTRLESNSHLTTITGGAAGNHTLTGIAIGDALSGIVYVAKGAENLTAVSDLGTEFTILDTDVIENAGHTATTGGYLIISWLDKA
jgi:hypothetical protein